MRVTFGRAALFILAFVFPAHAEEFYCEIMALEGMVTVTRGGEPAREAQEGDLLAAEDVIEAGDGAYADLAYDREWNNVTRLEANSKLRIRTLYPTSLGLESGGLFAKLKQLPKESTFEVQTPTAIASVRGTEYRTTYIGGETQIFNVSDSDVYVYGVDAQGARQSQPVVLRNAQTTQVRGRGFVPMQPRRMEEADLRPAQHARQRIEERVQQNLVQGRFGRIQGVRQVESGEWKAMPRDEGRSRPPMRPLEGEAARNAVERMTGRSDKGFHDGPEPFEKPRFGPGPRQEVRRDGLGRRPDGQNDGPQGSGKKAQRPGRPAARPARQ